MIIKFLFRRVDTRETDEDDEETDISGNKDVSGNEKVFNIANNIYTYDDAPDAQTVCSIYDAKLARYDMIKLNIVFTKQEKMVKFLLQQNTMCMEIVLHHTLLYIFALTNQRQISSSVKDLA